MLRLLRNRRGQNTAEYAIVIGLVVAAAIAMQTYIKRGIQAKVKDGTNALTSVTGDVGDGTTLGTTSQYEPYYMETNFNVNRGSASTDTVGQGGSVTRTLTKEDTSRTGSQTIGDVEQNQ